MQLLKFICIHALVYFISLSLQYDHYYVGTPPAKEVTFSNLNDNIDRHFLENMVKAFGLIEDAKIYYHPKNKKHLGIGKVSYLCTSNRLVLSGCVKDLKKKTNLCNIIFQSHNYKQNKNQI